MAFANAAVSGKRRAAAWYIELAAKEAFLMSLLERYRTLYEYEKDCSQKMLAMLESVPAPGRTDPRFQQAISIADHLAACREFWLDCMGKGSSELTGWNKECNFSTLRSHFAAIEPRWTDFLARLDDSRLTQDFEFTEPNGETFRLPIGVQIEQLAGHATYHRGQIALLVDQLGGEVGDTDYADWWWVNNHRA